MTTIMTHVEDENEENFIIVAQKALTIRHIRTVNLLRNADDQKLIASCFGARHRLLLQSRMKACFRWVFWCGHGPCI
jgi:hypothetical protein